MHIIKFAHSFWKNEREQQRKKKLGKEEKVVEKWYLRKTHWFCNNMQIRVER